MTETNDNSLLIFIEKRAFFGSIGASAAGGFGNAVGEKSLSMIGKMGDSIMASMQRRNKDKILKDMSVMYPQLSNRDKQKVNIAFEMIDEVNTEISKAEQGSK